MSLLAFNLLLNDVDFASQVPAHLPINSKKYLTTLQDHIATNVKSLTEVSEDFPNTVVFPTVFHVDESGDQGNSSDLSQPLTKCRKEKRVRNVVATVRLWISILSERYENEVKQIAGLDTCGDSVRNEICCWLRLKNSYERIVLPLQDEYMYLTVQEVKTVDTELYEEWEGLTSAITEEYNSLVEEFEYYTLLHKLLTAFEEVPFDSVKYLMVPLIEDIKAYCERQEMENVFGEIVRIARVIDFQEIFVNYFFPDRSAVLWDEDRSLIEEKMKKSVGFLDDILQSIVAVYEEEENPSGEEIKALAEFQAFMDKKKTCFTLIPFIFNMNESIRKKQKLRNRIDQVDFTNNVEWETVITETIRKANDILKETESQMRNLSPELLFDEDRCLRHVEKFVDMINQSDETILGVVEIQVLGTQAITPAMYYLEAFREMFDLKEPKYETINQHMLRLFISEFESLEKYFLMNRERPVDMPRDKPVTLAKMEWAEQLIKKVNELIDMFKVNT
ncbi:dynein gamma chain, flagellar outer arm-like [Diaphorina citri]|uniref:Dynein gamma chain, flagellar outer arm-like n=1 Tax=Diaphorina citri TaxID=121845 RepID=A0A3Q0J1N9_DIACI|nr:dynein gamma chain, flagellar outer arm-like [Diaphorina citri]